MRQVLGQAMSQVNAPEMAMSLSFITGRAPSPPAPLPEEEGDFVIPLALSRERGPYIKPQKAIWPVHVEAGQASRARPAPWPAGRKIVPMLAVTACPAR